VVGAQWGNVLYVCGEVEERSSAGGAYLRGRLKDKRGIKGAFGFHNGIVGEGDKKDLKTGV
jgi:hypothetical protein